MLVATLGVSIVCVCVGPAIHSCPLSGLVLCTFNRVMCNLTCLFGMCGKCSWLRYCTGILTRVSVDFGNYFTIQDFGPTLLIISGLVALIVWSTVFCIEETNPKILICNESVVNDFCNLKSLESAWVFPLLILALFSLNASVWRGFSRSGVCNIH